MGLIKSMMKKSMIGGIVLLLLVIILTGTSYSTMADSNNSGNDKIISRIQLGGTDGYLYYHYNGAYYSYKDAHSSIQNNISKHLYNDFYQIKGIDPSSSIAIFDGSYYDLLVYAFKDTFVFSGVTYYFDPNLLSDKGALLGNSGSFEIYEMPGMDQASGVAVKIGNLVSPAYTYKSYICYSGIKYELELIRLPIQDEPAIPSGKADGYDIFASENSTDLIYVKINDHEMVSARAIMPGKDHDAIPRSIYGSDVESMYPCYTTIQWKTHGICSYSSHPASSDMLKKQLGKLLGFVNVEGFNYYIYQRTGISPTKEIIVKNNKVYQNYIFYFKDTVSYNNHIYVFDYANSGDKNEKLLASSSTYEIYKIRGIDSNKLVDVWVNVSVDDIGTLHTSFIASRIQ